MPLKVEKAGFIGLGNIGKPMAQCLLKGDFAVYVYDVFAEAATSLVEQGATLAASVAEMASQCQVIGVCVRDDQDVIDVMDQILQSPDACKVVAIHSTVKPETIVEQAERAAPLGVQVIDAPITGGATGAANGTLCYIVGGDESALNLCKPVFETSAKEIIHAGGLGMGMTAKLCNNLMTYAEFIAIYEAMRLAKATGLSTDVVKAVGAANGNITEQMNMFTGLHEFKPHLSAEDFQNLAGGFAGVAEKDLDITLQQASKHETALPGCERSFELIKRVYMDAYDEESADE